MDRRQEKTRNGIFKSFSNLLLEKNYTDITIRHIIEGANVGRATFYTHFSDKDNLFASFCKAVLSDVLSGGIAPDDDEDTREKKYQQKCLCLMKEIKNSPYKIGSLINGLNGEFILKHFKNELIDYICSDVVQYGCTGICADKNDFTVNDISSTFFEIIKWWTNGNNNISAEAITEKFLAIVKSGLGTMELGKKEEYINLDLDTRYSMSQTASAALNPQIQSYLKAYEILSKTTDDYIFVLDLLNKTQWLFGSVERDFNLKSSQGNSTPLSYMEEIVYPADLEAVRKEMAAVSRGEKAFHNMDYRWVNRRGEIVWINSSGKAIEDENGKPFIVVGRVSMEAMRHLYNPLTGLFNKVKMREDFKDRMSALTGGQLMLIDIDDLAAINLSHGRNYGDSIVRDLGSFLDNHPSVEVVYHTELSYFAAWLNTTTEAETLKVFYDVQNELSQKCTVTAGVIPLDSNLFIDHTNLYDSAKITLRNAKSKGKGAIDFFSPEEIKRSIYSVELIEELHESTRNGFEGFKVNYQPQVKSGSYDIFSVEALMRYHSKSRGPVFPDEFIPLLEKSGLINPVGIWILEEALTQCKKWREHIPNLRVSVNFSTIQFREKDIVENILAVLKKTKMSGDVLTIELTESVPLNEINHFSSIISRLKQKGIQIAIDDFGTGYSNIGYLKKLDVDEIKIDRMFVTGIAEDTYNYKLISNTMEFAKMNSIRICCEGVETGEELGVLETLSPDILQGYLFDKPCEVVEFEEAYIIKQSEKYKTRIKFIRQLYEYKEKMGIIHFEPTDILRETNVGLWVIRINESQDIRELYADETMERILGLDKKYTPRETYDFWFNRINDTQVEYVSNNIDKMQEINKVVQLQYKWNHPALGSVEVRSSGRRAEDADGMIVLEGYHRILSNIEEL